MLTPARIAVSEEVRDALDAGNPVLACESTIFTHGLPRPRDLEVARTAEERIRAAGVVPATIGVLNGIPTVGLDPSRIDELCADPEVAKITVRDLPLAAATSRNGGTTVAATALLAHRCGIRVFATGGLGGVHHGASTTFDESADIGVLATTPITVVSAGVKSILDVAATLERLETHSIPVVGYRTDHFPGFYTTATEHHLEYTVDSPAEAAEITRARDALELPSAILVANPVPESEQLDPAVHRQVLNQAWAAADEQGVTGHGLTPFLLDHIQRATGGRSLDANIAAYLNNIALGARIAVELA